MSFSGAMYAMPIIVLNLGGEMLYILNQRLQAQSIADEKSRKVLQDVVRAMFATNFIQELFKPQFIYTAQNTKAIFEKLAHSSIMRLNKSSMDKLYDLMMMGFKYQILQCASPQQYLHMLLIHLENLKSLISHDVVGSLVQYSIDSAIRLYSTFSITQWIILKQTILRFIQGKRVKVSLFLQNQLQSMDGVLALDNSGNLPYKTDIPGTIKYFENNSIVFTDSFDHELKNRSYVIHDIMDVYSLNGSNMYIKDYRPEIKISEYPLSSSVEAIEQMKLSSGIKTNKQSELASAGKSLNNSVSKSSAKAELNLLSDLLGLADNSSEKDDRHFKINLFPASTFEMKDSNDEYSTNEEAKTDSNIIIFDIDGTADAKSVSKYLEDLDLNDKKTASSKVTDYDDLLDLMDSAK